jgi:high affinity Mn2+ porin
MNHPQAISFLTECPGSRTFLPIVITMCCTLCTGMAQESSPDTQQTIQQWNLHFQQTVIVQGHPAFSAKYSGENSLRPQAESQTSITSTLFFGLRLWSGAELYLNPELSGGRGVSDASGVAGFPNGETFRIGNPEPAVSAARIFVKQRVAFGDESENEIDGPNQLRGSAPTRCLTVVAGKFSLVDFFDGNSFSHDPRTQFSNWALMDNGAWDYAADTRGYTWGLFVEYRHAARAFRTAAVLVPTTANGMELDTRIKDAFSLNVEYEQGYVLGDRKGTVRVFGFRNQARMGNYAEAINEARGAPEIVLTRENGRVKYGFGFGLEQMLSEHGGFFLRGGWNDGHTETWAFTEIDRTVSAGILSGGELWKRMTDKVGIAFSINGLSRDHADFLAAGGYGFIIGDGALRYADEMIAETFYSAQIISVMWVTLDYQFVLNPAYNRDRGPVHLFAVRLHTEF